MNSINFSKQPPLALALRATALAFVLLIFGLHLQWLPEQVQRIKRGVIWGINFEYSGVGNEAVVNSVNMEAIEKGVSVGDKVLNPEAVTEGEIGTSVTLLIKSGDAPVREVTFIPESPNYAINTAAYTEFLGLSPRARLYFSIIFLWISVFATGVFSVVAFWFRSNAWLAFFVVAAITNFLSIPGNNLAFLFFWSYFPTALILFLILFPNGKLDPKWSWFLVLLPVPSTLRMASFYYWQYFTRGIFDGFNPTLILLILCGVIVYRYRKAFTLIERRRMKWLLFGLALISIPHQWLIYLGVSRGFIQNLNSFLALPQGRTIGLFTQLFHSVGLISILLVLGVVVYRYRNTFTPVERQQTRWLVVSLALGAPPIIVLKIFTIYYFYSNQHSKLVIAGYISDRVFLLGLAVFAFCGLLAALRYRLEDIDSFINRALVYSGLMAMVGVIWLIASAFIDYTLGEIPAGQKAFMVIPISVFLIVVGFKPARFRLQALVDEYFRPEGFDFAQTFPEFTPEMRGFFNLPELSKLLVAKSYQQFGVAYVSAFIKNKNGKLRHSNTVLMSGKIPKLVIESQELSKLERSELVPDIDSDHSMIVPLVLSHGQKPNLVGALVLGPRLNGLGYSTEMKRSLNSFGEEVGKALYIAWTKEQK